MSIVVREKKHRYSLFLFFSIFEIVLWGFLFTVRTAWLIAEVIHTFLIEKNIIKLLYNIFIKHFTYSLKII